MVLSLVACAAIPAVAAPLAPTLVSPARGATEHGHVVTFQWNAVPDAATYRIVVTDQGTGLTIQEQGGLTGTSASFLLYDSTYSWTCWTADAGGIESPASEEWLFVLVNVDTVVPDCAITSPNGGETLAGGSDTTITWYCLDDLTPSPDLTISLFFSYDGGSSWSSIGSQSTNEGAYRWSVPRINSDQCMVRMTATDANSQTGLDVSDTVFSIVTDSSSRSSLTVRGPNGGTRKSVKCGSRQKITWDSATHSGDVSIKLFKGSRLNRVIARRTADDGLFTWRVPETMREGKGFRVRITRLDSPIHVADDSDKPFVIK